MFQQTPLNIIKKWLKNYPLKKEVMKESWEKFPLGPQKQAR